MSDMNLTCLSYLQSTATRTLDLVALLEYTSHRLVLRKHSREPWAFASSCSAPRQLEPLLRFKEKNTGLFNETHGRSCNKPTTEELLALLEVPFYSNQHF